MMSEQAAEVLVERAQHGPFERIVLTRPARGQVPAQLSVYRLGDTLIDAGSAPVAGHLVEALSAHPPKRIVCTHQHEDHVGGVGALRAAFGHLPVYAPEQHVALLCELGPVPPYRAEYWGQPEPIADALAYGAGQIFEVEGHRLQAVLTPGHTPGHMALLVEHDDAVFALSGDLYTGARPTNAWWESAADDIIASCRGLTQFGQRLRMLPTHGRVRMDGARRLDALADHVARSADRVRSVAEQLASSDYWSIAEAVFGPDDGMGQHSQGEFSTACFVRSVLDPVRQLPASAVGLPPTRGRVV